jgi:hypothetical protein
MQQSTAEKLGIRAGSRVLILGRSVSDATELVGTVPDGVTFAAESDVANALVLMFAETVADIHASARDAHDAIAPDGRLWIGYRKGATRSTTAGETAPLHRDTMQKALAELGLDGVTLISLDETWSAMRVKAV